MNFYDDPYETESCYPPACPGTPGTQRGAWFPATSTRQASTVRLSLQQSRTTSCTGILTGVGWITVHRVTSLPCT